MASNLEDLQQDLQITIYITSIASTLMCTTVLGCYICVNKLRKVEFFMIAMASLGNLIASLTLGIAVALPSMTPSLCVAQGFIKQYGTLMGMVWTSNIAYSIKLSIMQQTPDQKRDKYKIMFTIGFIGPLLLSLLPIANDSYQISQLPLSETICFIVGGEGNSLGDILVVICFQIPLVFSFFFNLICIYQVIQKYKKIIENERIINKLSRLLLYPFILIICWTSFLVWNIYVLFASSQGFIFQIICYGTSNLNGFFDGLAYGMIAIFQVWKQNKIVSKSLSDSILLTESEYKVSEYSFSEEEQISVQMEQKLNPKSQLIQ